MRTVYTPDHAHRLVRAAYGRGRQDNGRESSVLKPARFLSGLGVDAEVGARPGGPAVSPCAAHARAMRSPCVAHARPMQACPCSDPHMQALGMPAPHQRAPAPSAPGPTTSSVKNPPTRAAPAPSAPRSPSSARRRGWRTASARRPTWRSSWPRSAARLRSSRASAPPRRRSGSGCPTSRRRMPAGAARGAEGLGSSGRASDHVLHSTLSAAAPRRGNAPLPSRCGSRPAWQAQSAAVGVQHCQGAAGGEAAGPRPPGQPHAAGGAAVGGCGAPRGGGARHGPPAARRVGGRKEARRAGAGAAGGRDAGGCGVWGGAPSVIAAPALHARGLVPRACYTAPRRPRTCWQRQRCPPAPSCHHRLHPTRCARWRACLRSARSGRTS